MGLITIGPIDMDSLTMVPITVGPINIGSITMGPNAIRPITLMQSLWV